jgi:hypothetical protein
LGGIPSYLDVAFENLAGRPTEVVNAAAGGQDSNRVAAIVDAVAEHEPSAILIMSCNNEGAPPPSAVQSALLRQGGFRLLRAAMASPEPRAWFSIQGPEVERIREAFRANLRAMVAAGTGAGARIYLATLPIHLEYEGFTFEHMTGKGKTAVLPDVFALVEPRADLPPEWDRLPPCVAGIQLAEAGRHADAIVLLQHCLAQTDLLGKEAGRALPALAYALLTQGERVDAAEKMLQLGLGDCVGGGVAAVAAGRYEEALEVLRPCRDDISEVVRWSGFAQLRSGHVEVGLGLLRQAVEITPRNRCRPSFNEVIREVAAESPGGRAGRSGADLRTPLGGPSGSVSRLLPHGVARLRRDGGRDLSCDGGDGGRFDPGRVGAALHRGDRCAPRTPPGACPRPVAVVDEANREVLRAGASLAGRRIRRGCRGRSVVPSAGAPA